MNAIRLQAGHYKTSEEVQSMIDQYEQQLKSCENPEGRSQLAGQIHRLKGLLAGDRPAVLPEPTPASEPRLPVFRL